MARVACVAFTAELDVVLARVISSTGWRAAPGMLAIAGCVLASVVCLWLVIALREDPLVLQVTRRGIRLGPTLGQLLTPADNRVTGRMVEWAEIRLAVVDVREARITDSGVRLRQVQLRLTSRSGWWIERTLPAHVDVEALDFALRTSAPAATSVELRLS